MTSTPFAPVQLTTPPLAAEDWISFIRAVAPLRLSLTTSVLVLRLASTDQPIEFPHMDTIARRHLQERLEDHLQRYMRRRNQGEDWKPTAVRQASLKGIGRENSLAARPSLLGRIGLQTQRQAAYMMRVLREMQAQGWTAWEVGALVFGTAAAGVTRADLNQLPWTARHSYPRGGVAPYQEETQALARLVKLGVLSATHRPHGKGGPRKIRIWRTTTKGRVLLGGAWVAKERASSQPARAMERRAA